MRFDLNRVLETSEEYVFGNEWFIEDHQVAEPTGRREVLRDVDCRPIPALEHGCSPGDVQRPVGDQAHRSPRTVK